MHYLILTGREFFFRLLFRQNRDFFLSKAKMDTKQRQKYESPTAEMTSFSTAPGMGFYPSFPCRPRVAAAPIFGVVVSSSGRRNAG